MNTETKNGLIILVVEDVEETRDGIEMLLKADGYRVIPARAAADAVERIAQQPPHLILLSLGGPLTRLIQIAGGIRSAGGLSEAIPVVLFCVEALAEGEEAAIGRNMFIIHPDNFNQLRAFLQRLLGGLSPADWRP
jgi:CheY-like chemotaxis protein